MPYEYMNISGKKIWSATQIIFLVIFSFIIFWGFSHTQAFESIENWTFDLRQISFSPKTNVSEDIVMVWLDEQTMKNLPFRSPVPREFLAKLNNQILEAKPKLVAYDIFLKDPSFEAADLSLAESLKKGNSYAVMPMRIGDCHKENKNLDGCVDLPLPLFLNSLKGVGLADLPFNPFDSVVRSTRLEFKTDLGETPSLAALIYTKSSGQKAYDLVNDEKLWPHLGKFSLTPFTKPNGEIFIRFAGPPSTIGGKDNTFKVFPAHLVAKGLIPTVWLKDKIILVGAAYQDLEDAYLTPYYAKFTNYARMNGVEIHANILSSLLTKQFYYTFEPWQFWTLIGLAIIISLIFAALCPPTKSSITLGASIITYLFLVLLTFRNWGIVLPVLAPISAGVISYGVGISWRALTEGRQRRWIKGVFTHYVPPAVVDQLIQDPGLLKLGGEEKRITSFFSDIASFTTFSERMDPPTLVKFLNEYLSLMNAILFRYGGTIDKYEGDAIVAFFNAPLDVANHAKAASLSALEVQIAGQEITKKWEATLGRSVVTRVGINTGPAVVGNIGSETRFDYTAIGDTVNLASRLEGTNKFYGTKVMASEETIKGIDDSIIVRPIDRVRVKGKEEAILLYEVMGRKIYEEPRSIITLSQLFRDAFDKFEARALDETHRLLQEILNNYPDDGPSKELLNKYRKAKEDPSWDLITDLVSK